MSDHVPSQQVITLNRNGCSGSFGIRTDNTAIVEAIVLMANRFNLKLIAEGVENKAEVDYLTSIGCYEFQGFHFYKPMPFKEFISLVE
jgi:EAL domain-containing protein (putative c-di-GMP-specific phosphodiesterase class I)